MKTRSILTALTLYAGWLSGMPVNAQEPNPNSRHDRTEDQNSGLHADGAPWNFHSADEMNEALPNVLLIGDSILSGYGGYVIKGLQDTANVDRWITGMHLNSQELHGGLKQAVTYRKYDVIHFNIGLHGWPNGRIPKGQYGDLMRAYVAILKENAPEAKLIWCSTTQVHEQGKTGEDSELNRSINPIIVQRNGIAAEIMKEEAIPINDLYRLMSDKLRLVRGDRFHWQGEAYKIMSNRIVATIRANNTGNGPEASSPQDHGRIDL